MSGLETIVEDGRWSQAIGDVEALAARCFEAARAKEEQLGGTATLLLADDAVLKSLNAQFRGQDKATNVLSFPSGEPSGFLGDVAIAYETAAREAAESMTPFADHAAHLVVHGLLHLVGYDHMNDAEAETMEALEVSILDALGVSNPYEREEL